ncbi:helix-turn-helix domain-containing protein [Streptomyces arenae]|nr:helix-turn-helix domain-containing protein [Streptomyces arenae]
MQLDDGDRLAARLLGVLRAVRAAGASASLAQVVRLTGLPKSTAHRLLAELQAVGIVRRDGMRYQLGDAVWELTVSKEEDQARKTRKELKPLLLQLHGRTRYLVGLGVPSGGAVRFIDLMYGEEYRGLAGLIEEESSLMASAAGKALLAHCPQLVSEIAQRANPGGGAEPLTLPPALSVEIADTQRRGFSLDQRPSRLGIAAAAVPVFGMSEQPLAALSIGAYPQRFDLAMASALLRHTAAHASRVLRQHTPR